jgi:hypothetical protein
MRSLLDGLDAIIVLHIQFEQSSAYVYGRIRGEVWLMLVSQLRLRNRRTHQHGLEKLVAHMRSLCLWIWETWNVAYEPGITVLVYISVEVLAYLRYVL